MKKYGQWVLLLLPAGLVLWLAWRWYNSRAAGGGVSLLPGGGPAGFGSSSATAGGAGHTIIQTGGGGLAAPFQANLSSGVTFDLTKAISGTLDYIGKVYDSWTGGQSINAQNQALNDQAINAWAGYVDTGAGSMGQNESVSTNPAYSNQEFGIPDFSMPSFDTGTGGGGGDLSSQDYYLPSDFGSDEWG